MFTIGVDLDNTLADFTKNCLSRFERDFGVKLSKEEWENVFMEDLSTYLSSIVGTSWKEVDDWLHKTMDQDGFFFEQDMVEGFDDFYEFYHSFDQDIDLYFITSVPITSTYAYRDKYQWVKKYMDINKPQMVFTKFKHVINLDVLIDDFTENLDMAISAGNLLWDMDFILFPQPYNKQYFESLEPHPNMYRPENWKEICGHLQQCVMSAKEFEQDLMALCNKRNEEITR